LSDEPSTADVNSPLSRRRVLAVGAALCLPGPAAGCLGLGPDYRVSVSNERDEPIGVAFTARVAGEDATVVDDEFDLAAYDPDDEAARERYDEPFETGTAYSFVVEATADSGWSVRATPSVTLDEEEALFLGVGEDDVSTTVGELL
jgi:hypothetical protein